MSAANASIVTIDSFRLKKRRAEIHPARRNRSVLASRDSRRGLFHLFRGRPSSFAISSSSDSSGSKSMSKVSSFGGAGGGSIGSTSAGGSGAASKSGSGGSAGGGGGTKA
jgi:hypothetical protein